MHGTRCNPDISKLSLLILLNSLESLPDSYQRRSPHAPASFLQDRSLGCQTEPLERPPGEVQEKISKLCFHVPDKSSQLRWIKNKRNM
jgi:hypothetical protein